MYTSNSYEYTALSRPASARADAAVPHGTEEGVPFTPGVVLVVPDLVLDALALEKEPASFFPSHALRRPESKEKIANQNFGSKLKISELSRLRCGLSLEC